MDMVNCDGSCANSLSPGKHCRPPLCSVESERREGGRRMLPDSHGRREVKSDGGGRHLYAI